jgi:hypothetical protein
VSSLRREMTRETDSEPGAAPHARARTGSATLTRPGVGVTKLMRSTVSPACSTLVTFLMVLMWKGTS